MQGYLFSAPKPVAQIKALLAGYAEQTDAASRRSRKAPAA
jgi:hypothetical protein